MTTPNSAHNNETVDDILHELNALSSLDNSEEYKDLLVLKELLIGTTPPSTKEEIAEIPTPEILTPLKENPVAETPEPLTIAPVETKTLINELPEIIVDDESKATIEIPSELPPVIPESEATTLTINDKEEIQKLVNLLSPEIEEQEKQEEKFQPKSEEKTPTGNNKEDLQELVNLLFGLNPDAPKSEEIITHEQESLKHLREILIVPESTRIDVIEQRLNNLYERTSDVAEILPEALGNSNTEDTTIALRSYVEKCLTQSVQNNTKVFADAIYPIIGPAIQQSISKTLKAMLQSLNQAVEQGLSIRGLLWRFQSWRTGVPFREIVLKNTLTFRVEQVFLIHKETGLLLQHACLEDVEEQRDSDAVSAMLTAIQDFINDSFSTTEEDQDLETVEIGENTVFLIHCPIATLACVIRGIPPHSLRGIFAAALKEIQIRFRPLIENFEGDSSTLIETLPVLESCLISETEVQPLAIKRLLLILGCILALFSYWGYNSYLVHKKVEVYLNALQQTDGIVIIDSTYTGQHLYIEGLHDPFATDPEEIAQQFNLNTDELTANWENYQSLTPDIMLQRAKQILSPPEKITLSIQQTTLYATGLSSPEWLEKFNSLGILIPGIEYTDSSNLQDNDQFLLISAAKILQAPDSVTLSVKDKVLSFKGTAPLIWVQDIPKKMTGVEGIKSYRNYLNKQEALVFDDLLVELENTVINFNDETKTNLLTGLLPKFQQLFQLSQALKITSKINVLAYYHKDDNALSSQRNARQLVQYLQQQLPQQYAVSHSKQIKQPELEQKISFSIETKQPKVYANDWRLTQAAIHALNPPASVYLEVEKAELSISGSSNALWQQKIDRKIQKIKGLNSHHYRDFKIQENEKLQHSITEIEAIEIYFENQAQFAPLQEEVFIELARKFKQLSNLSALLKQKIKINVTGHTDQTGSIRFNQKLALKRANETIQKLQAHKLKQNYFHAKIAAINRAENTTKVETHKRKVTFKVIVVSQVLYNQDIALKKQLIQLLQPPKSIQLQLKNAVLHISGNTNYAWYTRALKQLKTLKALKSTSFDLHIDEEQRYKILTDKIQQIEITFSTQQTLNKTEKEKLNQLAQYLKTLYPLSQQIHKNVKLSLFSYMLRKNSSYRKKAQQRADNLILQLKKLGVADALFDKTQYKMTPSTQQENKVTFNLR